MFYKLFEFLLLKILKISWGKAVSEDIRKDIIHLYSKGKFTRQIVGDVNLSQYTWT